MSDEVHVSAQWTWIVHFFQRAVSLSADRWLSVRIALVAAGKRDPDILLSVAPEVREAAEPLYTRFLTPWQPLRVDPARS